MSARPQLADLEIGQEIGTRTVELDRASLVRCNTLTDPGLLQGDALLSGGQRVVVGGMQGFL